MENLFGYFIFFLFFPKMPFGFQQAIDSLLLVGLVACNDVAFGLMGKDVGNGGVSVGVVLAGLMNLVLLLLFSLIFPSFSPPPSIKKKSFCLFVLRQRHLEDVFTSVAMFIVNSFHALRFIN